MDLYFCQILPEYYSCQFLAARISIQQSTMNPCFTEAHQIQSLLMLQLAIVSAKLLNNVNKDWTCATLYGIAVDVATCMTFEWWAQI